MVSHHFPEKYRVFCVRYDRHRRRPHGGGATRITSMKRRKSPSTQEVELPITDLSLEQFEQIIASGCVEGEVPFELLAEHFPELLSKWYPGYPGEFRLMTKNDPFPARAQVKNGMMTIDIPCMKESPQPVDADTADGFYDVWLKREGEKWTLYGTWMDADDKSEGSSLHNVVASLANEAQTFFPSH